MSTDQYLPADYEGGPLAQIIQAPTPAAMEVQARVELDVAINTAKKYPRDMRGAVQRMTAMATFSEETAAACSYSLERKSKDGGKRYIEGASIRLAEIAATCWGNIKIRTQIKEIGREQVTVCATCKDLETNVEQEAEVVRRITDKYGRRYGEDMIAVTLQAASAIARRNAILMIVPKAFIDIVRSAAIDVATGKGEPIERRRQRCVDKLTRAYGLTEDRIAAAVGKRSMLDVTQEDLGELYNIHQAVKSGEATLDEAFPDPKAAPKEDEPKAGADATAARLKHPEAEAPKPARKATTKPAAKAPEATAKDSAVPADMTISHLSQRAEASGLADLIELVGAYEVANYTARHVVDDIIGRDVETYLSQPIDLNTWAMQWAKLPAEVRAARVKEARKAVE